MNFIKKICQRLWCNHLSMTFIDWKIEEHFVPRTNIMGKQVNGKIYKCNICGKEIHKPNSI